MKAISLDAARDNLTVNNRLPERSDTYRQQYMAEQTAMRRRKSCERARGEQVGSIAARRLGRPEESGALCAFIYSQHAGFVSGQNFHVDGGSYSALILGFPMAFLPKTNFEPPFDITRTSHVVLTVADLAASRRFYAEVIGLVVTRHDDDMLYLRGIEEACDHSLVLRRTNGKRPACMRIGMRVRLESDLDKAFAHFAKAGCPVQWADVPHQGKTLHVTDPFGLNLEFCAHMPLQPRQITNFSAHKGGCAQRIDHYQVLTPDARAACEFYTDIGFMLTEYIAPDESNLRGVFLQRKGNPHDIVFFSGAGPRLHHFAYLVPEVHHLLRACDVAGSLGYGREVERGPGRHGPGHAMFVYFRDPDGHRIELFNTHYQVIDVENEPVRWDPTDANISFPWGLPAQRSWFEQATPFDGQAISEPATSGTPMTLERYLAAKG